MEGVYTERTGTPLRYPYMWCVCGVWCVCCVCGYMHVYTVCMCPPPKLFGPFINFQLDSLHDRLYMFKLSANIF